MLTLLIIFYSYYIPNNLPPLDLNLISRKSGLFTLILSKKPLLEPEGHHFKPNSQQCKVLYKYILWLII